MGSDPVNGILRGGLRPRLEPGVYVFVTVESLGAAQGLGAVATIREDGAVSAIVPREAAEAAGITGTFECAWITLDAETDLDLVGLTAAVAGRLTEAGIACNVVAGARHDHLFVAAARGDEAVALLSGD